MRSRSFIRGVAGALAFTLVSFACTSGTGGRLVPIEMRFTGDPSASTFTTALGFEVTLEEAELVLGPIYAFAPADEPIAFRFVSIAHAHGGLDPLDGRKVRAELLERVRIDALSAEPRVFEAIAEAGVVDELRIGLEPDASLLEGRLARVVGTATRDGVTRAFEAFVDVGSSATERRVLMPFAAELREDTAIELTLDPRAWLDGVAFDRLGSCESRCDFPSGSQAASAAALGIRSARAYGPRLID